MPITINGSGTLTGISAGGLPDGCVTGDDIANSTVTATKLGTTEQSRLCRAWVNFDGTGTVAIRASYNVSSITDNGVGDYTINFAAAMPDANYSFSLSGRAQSSGVSTGMVFNQHFDTSPSSSAIRITSTQGGSFADISIISVAIFR